MEIIETYNIVKIKENNFLNIKLNQAQKHFNQIQDIIENWNLYLTDFTAKELKEDIKIYENKLLEILNWLQYSNRITFTNNNQKINTVKTVKSNFENFDFVVETKGIKIFRKGKGLNAYVSYNGEKPTKYPFAKINDFVN